MNFMYETKSYLLTYFLGDLRSSVLGPARASNISEGGVSLVLEFSVLTTSPKSGRFSGGVFERWKPWGSYASPMESEDADDGADDSADVEDDAEPEEATLDILGALLDCVMETLADAVLFTTGERFW